SGHNTCLMCQRMSLKMAHGEHFKIAAHEKQLQVSSPSVEALADRLSQLDGTDCIVLEGHVRLKYHKEGIGAEVSAERAVVDFSQGHLQIMGSPAANKPPAVSKDNVFQFWIGMCH